MFGSYLQNARSFNRLSVPEKRPLEIEGQGVTKWVHVLLITRVVVLAAVRRRMPVQLLSLHFAGTTFRDHGGVEFITVKWANAEILLHIDLSCTERIKAIAKKIGQDKVCQVKAQHGLHAPC